MTMDSIVAMLQAERKRIDGALKALGVSESVDAQPTPKKRGPKPGSTFSAEARARMAAAQQARQARNRAAKNNAVGPAEQVQ
jgi:hypothetical protein